MMIGGCLLAVLALLMIGIWIYQKMDPGRWENNADPDPNAKIVDVSSTFKRRSSLSGHFVTEVTFSDGYVFESTKTKTGSYEPAIRAPVTVYTRYYIDEELHEEIVNAAIEAHRKAVEKELRNRVGSMNAHGGKDVILNMDDEKKEKDMLKCEVCGESASCLVPVVIKDKLGTRHRNVCASCFKKYS